MARRNPWLRLSSDAWSLAIESSSVIGLRAMTIAAGGPNAQVETERMVREKIEAGLDLQAKALSGGLGVTAHGAAAKTVAHYRRRVRANRRRLVSAMTVWPWSI